MPHALVRKTFQSMNLLSMQCWFCFEIWSNYLVSIVDRRMWVLPGDSLEERGGLPLIVLLERLLYRPSTGRRDRRTNRSVRVSASAHNLCPRPYRRRCCYCRLSWSRHLELRGACAPKFPQIWRFDKCDQRLFFWRRFATVAPKKTAMVLKKVKLRRRRS